MPKGFFKIPNIKGDMAQKPLLLFTMYGAHDHVQKHGKCSNHRKLHLNDPADLLINIIYYNLCQRSSTSKARKLHAVLAKIHGLYTWIMYAFMYQPRSTRYWPKCVHNS